MIKVMLYFLSNFYNELIPTIDLFLWLSPRVF